MISYFSKDIQNFKWLSQIINAYHDFYVVRIRHQEKTLFELEIAYQNHGDYGFKQPTKVTYLVSHETQVHTLCESRPKQHF